MPSKDDLLQQFLTTEIGVTQDLVPEGRKNRPGKKIKVTHITIHNTDNETQGADAKSHAAYIKGDDAEDRPASWHFTVDDKRVIQHLPIDEMAYHAKTNGNKCSIGIEICVNRDIEQDAADHRAARLIAALMVKTGVDIKHVVTHKSWTGKYCPSKILSRPNGWESFIQMCHMEHVDLLDHLGNADDKPESTDPMTALLAYKNAAEAIFSKEHPDLTAIGYPPLRKALDTARENLRKLNLL